MVFFAGALAALPASQHGSWPGIGGVPGLGIGGGVAPRLAARGDPGGPGTTGSSTAPG